MIFLVVDHLTKYAHFLPFSHAYNVVTIVKLFIVQVFKLHGMTTTIVIYRNIVFTSFFRKELFRMNEIQLNFSSGCHPQLDGQIEIVHKCVQQFLRCFVSYRPKKWIK